MATLHSAEFSMESVIRGHHVYKYIWSSVVGEELECRIKAGNVHNLYAVSVIRSGTDIVGHIPRNISTPCNLFLRKGGAISCVVSGHRQYSSDLPQGGLEVLCQMLFKGTTKMINKIKSLLQDAATNASQVSTSSGTSSAKIATGDKITCNSGNNDVSTENSLTLATASTEDNKIRAKVNPEVLAETIEIPVSDNPVCENTDDVFWVKVGKCALLMSDKECLLTPGSSLTDKHVNFAQTLLRSQYPSVSGLTSTLLQYKSLPTKLAIGLQMIHCRSSHWVTAYKEDSSSEVKVYDSLFDSVDDITETVIMNVFEAPKIKMAQMQKQTPGSNNCGLFAIAVCTAILLKKDPSCLVFDEKKMRCHLSECFERKSLTNFPCVVL